MTRQTFVFRLEVQYPDGSVWDPEHPEDHRWWHWAPEGWAPEHDPDPESDDGFRWPRVRLYLNGTAAEARARLLRSYGATVEVVRSLPVSWPEGKGGLQEAPGQRTVGP